LDTVIILSSPSISKTMQNTGLDTTHPH